MSLYEVQRLMRDINLNPALRERFKAEREAILAGYELTDQERSALARGDLAALWDMGCHPLLLLPYSRAVGIPRNEYFGTIGAASDRRLSSVLPATR